MWKTCFDTSMIGGKEELAIWCENEADAADLINLLASHGCNWLGSSTLNQTHWRSYREETVYFITTNKTMQYGDRGYLGRHPNEKYLTCRYCGSVAIVEVEDLL